jgi:DNA-binding LacI/PurR family transcriptional regulator/DNA-binding transcriptional ArsR family regulator
VKLERYRQIAAELASEIENGKYRVGESFPIRSELAERFGVTRATVNRAMDLLIRKGLLTARRGAGTVVAAAEQRLKIAYVAPDWLMHYMPRSPRCTLTYVSQDDVFASKSKIRKLAEFDGVLWSHPDEEDIDKIIQISAQIPSVVVNRAVEELNYVATEYVDFFRHIVLERLKQHPDSTPYLLASRRGNRFIHDRRQEGYIAACRELKRFYEIVKLPDDFQEQFDIINQTLPQKAKQPLLVFADDWSHTGALIRWNLFQGFEWQKDIFYVDFDNTEHKHVWGLETTTILQDFDRLSDVALDALLRIIKNPELELQQYISPTLRPANT